MKKNRTMRVAVVMLALALITCCFVGSTFAKYVSEVEGTSTVKVATWKFTDQNATDVTSNIVVPNAQTGEVTFDLFAASAIKDTVDGNADEDVDDEVIAPGTKGEFAFDVKNESEVNATYAITFTVVNAANLKIQYSLDGTNWETDIAELYNADTDGDSTNDAVKGDIDMGQSLTQTIYWMWEFENGEDTKETDAGIAGNVEISVTANVVFTQVD